MERGGKLTEPCSLPSVGAAASEALVVHPEPRISLERWNIRLNLAAVRPRNHRGPPLQLEAQAWSFSRKPGKPWLSGVFPSGVGLKSTVNMYPARDLRETLVSRWPPGEATRKG